MSDAMSFPATVEEFMEQYKIVDCDHVYSNGMEMVPIFRMKQWFEHEANHNAEPGKMMDDTVSRQDAIDALFDKMDEPRHADFLYCDEIKNVIDALPTVQPEIIHCKDCRFWKKYKYFNGKPTYAPFCGFNSIFTDDNDFCSRAEKRGEAE